MGLTNIKYALEDHNLLDKEIRKTEMEWSLVRPVKLEHGDESIKDVATLGKSGVGMSMGDSITPASAARFLVKVTVEGLYVKEEVVIRN